MNKNFLSALLAASLVANVSVLAAQQTAPPPPDNTKVNKQGGQTADQQSQSKADLALAQKIRQAIVKDKTLSTNAHNCKVVTHDGAVTLRGPVNSAQEKTAIEKIAVGIAGDGKVTNDLTIKPSK
jgi:hyperosmotically inducible periplasmic protein